MSNFSVRNIGLMWLAMVVGVVTLNLAFLAAAVYLVVKILQWTGVL